MEVLTGEANVFRLIIIDSALQGRRPLRAPYDIGLASILRDPCVSPHTPRGGAQDIVFADFLPAHLGHMYE